MTSAVKFLALVAILSPSAVPSELSALDFTAFAAQKMSLKKENMSQVRHTFHICLLVFCCLLNLWGLFIFVRSYMLQGLYMDNFKNVWDDT